MTTILIVEGNTPGLLAAGISGAASFLSTMLAIDSTLEMRVASPYATALDQDQFEQVDGVVFTGSGEYWAADSPEARPQRAAMEASFERGLPVWGSCNGMQLATVVLGGQVGASPLGLEVGLAQVTRSADSHHPMMHRRPQVFVVPTVHRDEVTRLPIGAEVASYNRHCKVQGFAYGQGGVDFWGTQYHPELSARDIADCVRTPGIFSHKQALVADLASADTDADAAKRLGASPVDLTIQSRACELINWTTHVHQKAQVKIGNEEEAE